MSRPSADDTPLEPTTELPKAAPFKAGIGTWLGTGGGALAGAGLGAVAGGIIGLSAATNGMGGAGAAIVGVGALIGLVGGGIGTFSMIKSGSEKQANADLQAAHGTSTLEFARGMISSFDHNSNGQIDLVNSTGLASQDERVFSEQRQRSSSTPKYDFWADEWRTERTTWNETRGTSAAPVWASADNDPKDDVVSDVELARLMSKFDADSNGALTTTEQMAFKDAHPVIVDDWQR
jgi:hypothetical protein